VGVGLGVGLITTFGPVWIGMELRPDLVGVTTPVDIGKPVLVAVFMQVVNVLLQPRRHVRAFSTRTIPLQTSRHALFRNLHALSLIEIASVAKPTDARAANKISDFRMIDLPIS
jgi:hypothetical protein